MENNSLAPYGVICDPCLGFQRTKTKCVGCQADGNPAAACSDCPEYPCRRIKDLNKRHIAKYGENLRQNLESASTSVLTAFMAASRQKWSCPACGQLLCVHTGNCLHCGGPSTP